MGLAEVVVVDIVGGRHLQAARTKFDFDIAVLNDGNHAAHEGNDDFVAAQPLVLRVFGVDTHGRVAHDGFGAGRSHHGVVAAVGILMEHLALAARGLNGVDVGIGHVVAEVVEVALFLLIDDLNIGEGRLCLGVPVDHAQAAIDEALVVEVAEDAEHALAALVVHREGCAVPVARSTEAAQLLEDDAAVLVGPFPSVAEKFFARQLLLLDALLCQAVDHLGFGGDGGMVCARHPAGVLALHAGTANEDVLNRIIEHVAHVEHTRHVGRRDDYGVGLACIGF